MSNIKFPVIVFVFLFSSVLLAERGGMGLGPVAKARIVQEYNVIASSGPTNQNPAVLPKLCFGESGGIGPSTKYNSGKVEIYSLSPISFMPDGQPKDKFGITSKVNFVKQAEKQYYHLARLERAKNFSIENVRTIEGELITKEMMPICLPISNIESIETENGQILWVDEFVRLIKFKSEKSNNKPNLVALNNISGTDGGGG